MELTVTNEQMDRFLEWKYVYNNSVIGTLTEEEFVKSPQEGLDKPNGFYIFSFDSGKFYVQVEDKLVTQIIGYGNEETQLFESIEREYGEEIQRKIDAARVDTEQGTSLSGQPDENAQANKPDTPVAIQSDNPPPTPG